MEEIDVLKINGDDDDDDDVGLTGLPIAEFLLVEAIPWTA